MFNSYGKDITALSDKLQKLEEQVADLEKLTIVKPKYAFTDFPVTVSASNLIDKIEKLEKRLDKCNSGVLERFEELYQHLGIVRVDHPASTILMKKKK